jgi:hypothetical protein
MSIRFFIGVLESNRRNFSIYHLYIIISFHINSTDVSHIKLGCILIFLSRPCLFSSKVITLYFDRNYSDQNKLNITCYCRGFSVVAEGRRNFPTFIEIVQDYRVGLKLQL